MNIEASLDLMDLELSERVLDVYYQLMQKFPSRIEKISCGEVERDAPAVTRCATDVIFNCKDFGTMEQAGKMTKHSIDVGQTSILIPEIAFPVYVPVHEFFHTVFLEDMASIPFPIIELQMIFHWHVEQTVLLLGGEENLKTATAKDIQEKAPTISVGTRALENLDEFFAEAMTVRVLTTKLNDTARLVYNWARIWKLAR